MLEVSLSFDNAVVNATVLVRMNPFWQKIFLTVGVAIAVFGMRLVFPLLIVGITAKLSPVEAIRLALQKGDPDKHGTYGYLLHQAHPAIAAFGGVFLLMIFFEFVFEEREITWLSWLEKPLAKIGKLDQLGCRADPRDPGGLGLHAGAGQQGLDGARVRRARHGDVPARQRPRRVLRHRRRGGRRDHRGRAPGAAAVVGAVGKAAFFLFLYLEVLDASFSFDGVVGAFAITSDPIIIAIGLGVGAMFIRSLTVFLVRKGTLSEYVYLEHGALWAIGALAVLLLITIKYDVPEVVTGLIGVGFIGAAFASSVYRNKRAERDEPAELETAVP